MKNWKKFKRDLNPDLCYRGAKVNAALHQYHSGQGSNRDPASIFQTLILLLRQKRSKLPWLRQLCCSFIIHFSFIAGKGVGWGTEDGVGSQVADS